MIVNSYELNDSLQLTRIDSASVVEACRHPDARIWLDLQVVEDAERPDVRRDNDGLDDRERSSAEVKVWLDNLGIDGLARRLMLEARDRPGFYPLKRDICFVIPVLNDSNSDTEADYVGFVCRENLLLTLHDGPLLNRQRVNEFRNAESWLGERSIAALVSALMINSSLTCWQHATALRSAIVSLDEQMDRDPESVAASQIPRLRSQVLSLWMVATDQTPSIQALASTDKSFFHIKDAHENLNSALVNLGTASRILERADRSIDELRSRLDAHAQEKTNRRLGMLTILSAIFMPITLLAAIWGMNFKGMLELEFPYSYPIALVIMATVGTSMYLYFRRHGWLG